MTRHIELALMLGCGTVTLLVLALVFGCSTYKTNFPRQESYALWEPRTTTLDRLFDGAVAAHPGESGVSYIRYGRTALGVRIAMADLAERTLDLQYYIWDADTAGGLLAERLVRAAERGVRVLLDDHSIADRDAAIARLSGHPNIEVRAFNPFRYRNRWGDFFSDPFRINRRSHNKVMVADNAIAIVGGRNIADHYYGVHGESNYRDLDVAAVGPVVRDISAVFDVFWNSKFAIPYAAFVTTPPTPAEAEAQIATMRARVTSNPLPYPLDEDETAITTNLEGLRDEFIWAPVRVLYDNPAKAEDPNVRDIIEELYALTSNAKREVLIENAYFVPRERMVEFVAMLVQQGVKVRVLANSLISNDVVPVHAGYKKYRDDLLTKGAEIYEFRPDSAIKQHWSLLSAKSRAGLHTKTMVVDREHTVIGSYNLDPRSSDINTELALLVDSAEFGQNVAEFLDDGVKPENSYRVTLEDGNLKWTTFINGKEVVYTQEPETSWWQRFTVGFFGLLPIHSQL